MHLLCRKGKEYLKWYQKIAYGAGDLAKYQLWTCIKLLYFLYLSDTMGLNMQELLEL